MKLSTAILTIFFAALLTPVIELLADIFETNFGLILVVGLFIILDTITGIAVNISFVSSKQFGLKMAQKIIAYGGIIGVGFGLFILTQTVDKYTMDVNDAETIITYTLSVVMVREFWSIFENVDKLQPELTAPIKAHFKRILKLKK